MYATRQTTRLVLRPFQAEDWPAVHAYAGDPEAVQHMTWGPNTVAETRAHLESTLARFPGDDREHAFAITLRETGALIGSCSLMVESEDRLQGWFGYILNRAQWGKGYATEAGSALLGLGFDVLNMHRIYATCRPENEASRHVLEKLGLRQEAHFSQQVRIRGGWRDSLLYAILQSEWQSPDRQAFIFDMDGVLADTEPVYFESNTRIFAMLGFSVDHHDYAQFVGMDADRMWSQLKAQHNLPHPIPELVKMEKDGMLAGLEQAQLTPMPGLSQLLAELQSRSIPLGLASSSSHAVINLILDKLELHGAFRVVVSGEDVDHGKPAPDIFLKTARLLQRPPAHCLVIEDSAGGVRAARAAGMRTVGFRNPNSGSQDLSPADRVVEDFSASSIADILSLLKGKK